jgi:hypothetical protein
MSLTTVVIPKLSEGMERARLLRWLKREGDRLAAGEIVAEIGTDKAEFELDAPGAGVLRRLLVEQGTALPVGTVIAIIAEPNEDISPALEGMSQRDQDELMYYVCELECDVKERRARSELVPLVEMVVGLARRQARVEWALYAVRYAARILRACGEVEAAGDLAYEAIRHADKLDVVAKELLLDEVEARLSSGDMSKATRLVAAAVEVALRSRIDNRGDAAWFMGHVCLDVGMLRGAAECGRVYLEVRVPPSEWRRIEHGENYLQVCRLFELSGERQRAAGLAREMGRHAKAIRLGGGQRYSMEEAPARSWQSLEQTIEYYRKSVWDEETKELYASGRFGDAARRFERKHWGPDQSNAARSFLHPSTCPHVTAYACVAELYRRANDATSLRRMLHRAETDLLPRGLWREVLTIYEDAGQLPDVERIAREADELECAVIAYEAAGLPDEAARIYAEMAVLESGAESTRPPQDHAGDPIPSDRACPGCGSEIEAGWVVCPECGVNLVVRTHCGGPLKPHWTKCPRCGQPV